MFRRFFRHIKEGFIGIGRHISMAFSSIASVTITLLLIGLFLAIVANLTTLTREVETSISLSALVSYDAEGSIDSIKTTIEKLPGVSEVRFQSKDEEFDYYVSQYPDLTDFYELYREDNPFHDAFLINATSGNQLENIKKSVEQINGIDSVHDGGSNTYLLVDALNKVRIFGGILVVSLAVLAMYLIYNTIHITIEARQEEITIMRFVGARNGYIRAPFLVEGILIGILGSIIPICVMFGVYLYAFDISGGVIFGVFKLIEPYPFLFYLCGVLLGIGIVVGFIGSYFSVTKSLWKTR